MDICKYTTNEQVGLNKQTQIFNITYFFPFRGAREHRHLIDVLKRAVTPPGEPDEVVQDLSKIMTQTSLLGAVLGPGDAEADPRHTWGVLTLENLGVIDQLDGENDGLVFPTKIHMTQSKTKTHWIKFSSFEICLTSNIQFIYWIFNRIIVIVHICCFVNDQPEWICNANVALWKNHTQQFYWISIMPSQITVTDTVSAIAR